MVKNKALKIAIIGYILIIVSFFVDAVCADILRDMHSELLTSFMYFVTDFGVIFLFAIIGMRALIQKKYRFMLFMAISVVVALEAAFLLKLLFQVPRPYVLAYTQPLFHASGYAFPSIHTAVLCSLLPFQRYLFGKKTLPLMYLFIAVIIFSRIYLGVHSVSDIVAGITVGLVTTYSVLFIEKDYRLIEWFHAHITDKFELRRQVAHLCIGGAIVVLLKLQLLTSYILFGVTIVGGIMVLIARKVRIPVFHDMLEFFERPHHIARFPGRGSFFLVLGAALATLIFDRYIAMAAIMIMAVGDSVTNVVGRHFGSIQNPFNAKKNIEGTAWAIVCSTLAALFFVPFLPALIASTVSMMVESIDLGIKRFEVEIDDNVVIPLVAGVIMTAMMG
ncbi:phosphatase PAP2 family protein [Candidatus Peregrinibacteria bacterium]|nr:phosphatase PAP2 family protein [Candidatus Peregrinibacteria bacterium]